MIERWNNVVGVADTVIVLGDISCGNNKWKDVIDEFNGNKKLIMGNHDDSKISMYLEHFKEIGGVGEVSLSWNKIPTGITRAVLTHIPVHPSCLDRYIANFHGHLHRHSIKNHNDWDEVFPSVDDRRYINVSCEQLSYTPKRIKEFFPK